MAKDFTELKGVIHVQVMQERDATIVSLRTEYATVKGSARRDPQDKHDPEVAYALAASRALEKLATRYRKRAQGRMNTLENNRKQAEAAALKKTRTVAATVAAGEGALTSFDEAFRSTTFFGRGFRGVNTIEGGFPRPEAWSTWRAGTVPIGESVMAAPPLKVVAEYELSDGRVLTVYRDGSTSLGAPQS